MLISVLVPLSASISSSSGDCGDCDDHCLCFAVRTTCTARCAEAETHAVGLNNMYAAVRGSCNHMEPAHFLEPSEARPAGLERAATGQNKQQTPACKAMLCTELCRAYVGVQIGAQNMHGGTAMMSLPGNFHSGRDNGPNKRRPYSPAYPRILSYSDIIMTVPRILCMCKCLAS